MGIQDMEMEGFVLFKEFEVSVNRRTEIRRNGHFSHPRNYIVLVVTGLSHKPFWQMDKRRPRKKHTFPEVFRSHGLGGGRRRFPIQPVAARPGSLELL